MARLLIAGCGFLGQATAQLFHDAGWQVIALTHTEESARKLAQESYRVLACDIADREAVEKISQPQPDAIIDCVSSGRGSTAEYRRNYFEGARNLLETFHPKKFLFTSSTSVYAQTDGSWVSENSPATPVRETGIVLRSTEELVLENGGIVARLAGLYGPGRAILLRKFFDGTAIIEGDGTRHINQIHRDDAARAILLLIQRNCPAEIYNVADDYPTRQIEIYQWLAERFGKPLPPTGEADPDRKRGLTDKRVSNARLRGRGWQPVHPSFQHAIINGHPLLATL